MDATPPDVKLPTPDLSITLRVAEVLDELDRRLERDGLFDLGYRVELCGDADSPGFRFRYRDRPVDDLSLFTPTLCREHFTFIAADLFRAAALLLHESERRWRP